MLDRAKHEFAETERYLSSNQHCFLTPIILSVLSFLPSFVLPLLRALLFVALESIAGPYVWGRYDLLVMPKSFPYGGMENPCLTYVTPTLLAGDRYATICSSPSPSLVWFVL